MEKNKNILVEEDKVNINMVVENDDVWVEPDIEDVAVAISVQETSNVSENEVVEIQIDEAFPYTTGDDAFNHAKLNNRDADNSHPISAIEGLQKELDDINRLKRIYSKEDGLAEFFKWDDDNDDGADRSGYFVKIVHDTDDAVANIDICTNKDDVYGVTVAYSGFVGNQGTEGGRLHSDDPAYAMVGIVGALRVRTDGTAKIGDYVVPSTSGIATKSEHECGYRVVSQGSYPSYDFVTIAVTPQNDKISKIYGMLMESGGNIGEIILKLDGTITDLEDTKTTVSGIVGSLGELEGLLKDHEVVIDGIKQTTDEVQSDAQRAIEDVQQMIDNANGVLDEAREAANKAHEVSEQFAYVSNLAAEMDVILNYEFKGADGTTYKGAGGIVQSVGENKAAMGDIMTQNTDQESKIASALLIADQNGLAIQHLIGKVDKYSVGTVSLSHGLTLKEAKDILVDGSIYVPTNDHNEVLYDYTTVVDPETNQETDAVNATTIVFERYFAYTWKPDDANGPWVKGEAVKTFTTYEDGENDGDLWYCWQPDITGNRDEPYYTETLYRWFGDMWVAVACMRENYRSRIVTSLKELEDAIRLGVTGTLGDSANLQLELEKIVSTVTNNAGYISAIEQTAKDIIAGVYSPDGAASSLQILTDKNTAALNAVTYGNFHVVHQSFATAAPDSIDGLRYNAPPTWNETLKRFEFSDAAKSDDGAYYFHSDDHTKYVKSLDDGGYEVYTIGNKAISALDSRISDTEAILNGTVEFATENSTALGGLYAKANANETSISSLASYYYHSLLRVSEEEVVPPENYPNKYSVPPEWDQSQNKYVFDEDKQSEDGKYYMADADAQTYCEAWIVEDGPSQYKIYGITSDTLAAIRQQADANGASIGLVVQDGKVQGGVIIEAINGQTGAWINANSIVLSTDETNDDGAFYMKLSGSDAIIRNGKFSVSNDNFRILLNPNDGICVEKKIPGATVTDPPTWLSTFHTDSNTGTTTIRGGCFRALGDDPEKDSDYTYSAVKQDGFYIYHESTMSEGTDPLKQIPKMKLVVNEETGKEIRVELGAGSGSGDSWKNDGKFILSKVLEEESDENGNVIYTNVGKITMGYKNGDYGFKLYEETLELLPGTKFKGAIDWSSVDESGSDAYGEASSAYNLANAIQSGECNGSFINKHIIYSPEIYSGKFYAINDDPGTYATMQAGDGDDTDIGFKIYHSSTTNGKPKIQLTTSSDGTINRLHIGAGSGSGESWTDDRKFMIEQDQYGAILYYKHEGNKYGFRFSSNGIEVLGGGTITGGTAVFG